MEESFGLSVRCEARTCVYAASGRDSRVTVPVRSVIAIASGAAATIRPVTQAAIPVFQNDP